MLILGVIVLIATIYCLIKRYETRLVLFTAGLAMCLIGGLPFGAFQGFSQAMKETKLMESIIAVMGFAMVLKYTECDQHLIHLLIKPLRKAGSFLIPAVVLVTFFINISITSSAGCSAAVGAILIPLMMAAGIHPAIAGAAIYAGTYGAMFNPGYPQVSIIVNVSHAGPVAVVANHFWALLLCGVIGAVSLWLVAKYKGEDKGYVLPEGFIKGGADFKVNYFYAFVPLLPIILLVVASFGWVSFLKGLAISHAMLIGCIFAFLVTRKSPQKISVEFWKGAGDSFNKVFGIIVCALIFVYGLQAVGIIQALIHVMTQTPAIAKVSAGLGPFILGIMSGSGDAAAVAFNNAVTIHAASFGIHPESMGSVVAIAGALGRTMSPVAGGMIVCATLAGVSPVETAKRNAPGMIVAMICLTAIMLFL